MGSDVYDAIVVGGGPAGSTAASFLSKKGRRVLLLEKESWPRDKTCGDAVSGKAVGILAELGLTQQLEAAPHAEVFGLTFSSPEGRQVSIPFAQGEENITKGYVCRRVVYDHILWKNASSLCEAVEGAEAVSLIMQGGKAAGVRAKTKSGEREFFGRLIIGADGVYSVVARQACGRTVEPAHSSIAYRAYYEGVTGMNGTLEVHFEKSIMPGYFWIFPAENGAANVGAGMLMSDVSARKINLAAAMERITTQNPLFKERFAGARRISPLKAWQIPLGSKRRKIHADNVLLVGDAACLVDPFSGEGMGNAMLSGKIAAEVADEALQAQDTGEAFLSRYPQRLWKEIGNELATSYTMQRLGKNQWLLNFVIGKAATSKKARDAIASTFSSKKARSDYLSPLFYLKLLFS
ncbi:MAG: NAD(P)/FAD-dependent oxidoreductase [Candidatus Micrarchaeota archaeon]|nr:NAD(P)/FAD-dependent oxidoreductase [Candidatus Micrarchaeota archaeon]